VFFLYFFSTFVWDPSRDLLVIPYLNHPLTWYGFLFALSFFIAFFVVRHIFTFQLATKQLPSKENKAHANELTDQLIVFTILGTLIGARLGHVFFYDWPYYSAHPLAILKVWEGGLASHGGAVGVLGALVLFTILNAKRFSKITFLATLDAVVIAASLIGGFIRIGNFINQEILGTPTTLPWGVIFLHPAQMVPQEPLHPVQIYESIAYFCLFALLIFVWVKRGRKVGSGLLSGLFFTLGFGFRFLIEFIKLPQSVSDENGLINMGQILSLPFIVLGLLLLLRVFLHSKKERA
jgi:phosphatidylglycerol:prolipoprotein diacylglycerol transferase